MADSIEISLGVVSQEGSINHVRWKSSSPVPMVRGKFAGNGVAKCNIQCGTGHAKTAEVIELHCVG